MWERNLLFWQTLKSKDLSESFIIRVTIDRNQKNYLPINDPSLDSRIWHWFNKHGDTSKSSDDLSLKLAWTKSVMIDLISMGSCSSEFNWFSVYPKLKEKMCQNYIFVVTDCIVEYEWVFYVPWVIQWTNSYRWRFNLLNGNLGHRSYNWMLFPLLKASIDDKSRKKYTNNHHQYPKCFIEHGIVEADKIDTMDWWGIAKSMPQFWICGWFFF